MRDSENFPVLQAVLQENISGPLPKSALLALKSPERSSNSSTGSDADLPVIGGVLKDGRYSWLSRGSKFVIILTKTNSVVSIYDFNQPYRESRFIVTACCACKNLIIVGLKGQDGRGCVAVYNPLISKLLKAIDIPYPVSVVKIIACSGGAVASTQCLCKNLRWLFGVVAVGTEEGHLYLVDLRFDSPSSSESIPSEIEIVQPTVRNVPRTREQVVANNGHLAFELQVSSHEEGVFHYASPDDEILDSFYPSSATVTSLLYESRVASLFVGFSFGQFQIFSLQDDMNLVHSSEFDGNSSPILKFSFQEPENDPRKFCYLWVAKGDKHDSASSQRSSEPLTLSMFQLAYSKKDILIKPKQEFGARTKTEDSSTRVLYKKFETCNLRFEHSLGPGFITKLSQSCGSSLLMCSSLEKFAPEVESVEPSEEEIDYSVSPAASFCVFGWQSTKVGRSGDQPELNVIVFDINRWYMAQMPHSFEGDEDDFLFAAFWSFENCKRILAENEEILGMHVPSEKIQHFSSGMRPLPERFFLPSACSFFLHSITNQSLNHFSLFGYQQQVLNSASELKSVSLVNPKEIHDDILASGLFSRQTKHQAFTPDMMRENVLTTALEHGQVGFLLSMVRDLANGHLAACGCTLRFVMDWAWKSVANVKNAIDELCVPIFDCSSPTLDALVRSRLLFNSTQIYQLRIVFQKLMDYTEDASDQSKEELKTKLNVVTLISQYLKVVQWFIGNGLLPEQLDNIENNEEIMTPSGILVYKYTRLRQVFDQRRSELNRSDAPDLLLIDGWVEEIGEPLTSRWLKEEGGRITYPPPSFMTLLDMYYLVCVDVVTKHCLVMYLLYDVLAMFSTLEGEDKNPNSDLHESQRERLNNIASFLESFSVPIGLVKLTQGFWLLDHKNFQDALNVFLDPSTSRPYLTWQERRILRAFLHQDHPAMALKYISTRHPKVETLDDAKMHITIFVKTREPLKAWSLVQMSAGQHDNKELFTHLFTLSQKHSHLDQLLKLPFSAAEEDMVIKYLKDSDSSEATQILVLFYLQQSKYVDAIRLHSQTKHIRLMRDQSDESRRRNAKLDHIVQSYSNLLPKIERELNFSGNKFLKQRVLTQREVYKPSTLPAILHPALNTEPKSHAGRLVLLIDKMEEKKKTAQETQITPLRRRRYGDAVDSKIPEVNSFLFPTVDPSKRRVSLEAHGILRRRSSFGSPARNSVSHDTQTAPSHSTASKIAPVGVKERRLPSLSVPAMLLQTPPITRSRSFIGQHDVAQSIQTPQSILKVKKFISRDQRLGFEIAKAAKEDENSESESMYSESSTDIKCDIPAISTPSAKLFRQTGLKKFKLETEERKTPAIDTPKKLRFARLDSSANDSGLSLILSSPVEQIAGLPNLTPVRVEAEDSRSEGEMEVDVTGHESENQDGNEVLEPREQPTQEQEEQVTAEISGIPIDVEQRLEPSIVEKLDQEEHKETNEVILLEEKMAAPEILEDVSSEDPAEESDGIICLGSSSEDEVEPSGDESMVIMEEEEEEDHLIQEVIEVETQEDESLRLILTSSDESLEEKEENKDVEEEDSYGTEEFTVQQESRDAVLQHEEILSSSLIIRTEVHLQQEDVETRKEEEEEEEEDNAPPTENIYEEPGSVVKDVFLGHGFADEEEQNQKENEPNSQPRSLNKEEQESKLSSELFVPHLDMEPHDAIEILASDDESDAEDSKSEEEESPAKDQNQEVIIQEEEEAEELKLHLSSELSDENLGLEEREDRESGHPSKELEDEGMFKLDEATSDYQGASDTGMEEVVTSPEQQNNPDVQEEKQEEDAAESPKTVHPEITIEVIPASSETQDQLTSEKAVRLEKGTESEKNLLKAEISIKPSTPMIDHIQTEPTFVLSPPTTRRSNRKTRESKATQYTPKPKPPAENKNLKSPSRVTRSASKQTQVTPAPEPTFLFSPPQTRERSSRKKDRSLVKVSSFATLSPPRSTTKRRNRTKSSEHSSTSVSPVRGSRRISWSRTKSPNVESDHSSTSVSPVRRSPRISGSRTKSPNVESDHSSTSVSPVRRLQRISGSEIVARVESSPERKPAPSTSSRKTRQSLGRKAARVESSPERKPAPSTSSRETRQSPGRKAARVESSPERKTAPSTLSKKNRQSPGRIATRVESSPERKTAPSTPSRKTRQSPGRKTARVESSPEREPAPSTSSRKTRQSPGRIAARVESSPERKPAPSTPSRKTRQSPGRKAPLTPTRSSSRVKSKFNVATEPENTLISEPMLEVSEDVILVSKRKRRKTSANSDVASSGTESETPATPSRRSTRRAASLKTSPMKETVKFPQLTPLAEEEEEEGGASRKKRKEIFGNKTTRTTRLTSSYPTRMRMKAKVFKFEEKR